MKILPDEANHLRFSASSAAFLRVLCG